MRPSIGQEEERRTSHSENKLNNACMSSSSRMRTTAGATSLPHRTKTENLKAPVLEALNRALDLTEQDQSVADQESSSSSSSPMASRSSNMRPPLDVISTNPSSSDTVQDCASVVSDMSSHSSYSHQRSIFQKYWDKHGSGVSHSPLRRLELSVPPPPNYLTLPSTTSCVDDPLFSCYEPTTLSILPCYVPESPQQQLPRQRRNIFGQGCWSKSEPSLDLKTLLVAVSDAATSAVVRKCNSASMLESSSSSSSSLLPHRSCLRRGRFSVTSCGSVVDINSSVSQPHGTNVLSRLCLVSQDSTATNTTVQESDSSSDCSTSGGAGNVSFSHDVNVVVFHPPKEIWAPKGWSQWFEGY